MERWMKWFFVITALFWVVWHAPLQVTIVQAGAETRTTVVPLCRGLFWHLYERMGAFPVEYTNPVPILANPYEFASPDLQLKLFAFDQMIGIPFYIGALCVSALFYLGLTWKEVGGIKRESTEYLGVV